jgi:pimeloyl-ACP methyl ester carboxylesterase
MPLLAIHEWHPRSADAGGGAPIALLVHGVTSWHRTWWRVGPALADHGWRAVAVDLRGHGHSPRITGSVTVHHLAEDVATTIEGLGGRADALIGHSLGGAVAAEVAHAHPELVGRLVLEDPPAISRVGDHAWLENLDREMRLAIASFDAEVDREVAANPEWDEEDARQDVEGKQLADRNGIVDAFRNDVGTRVLALSSELTIPTLYLLGAEGRSVFPADARRHLAETLPEGCRIAVVDAGHTIHRDRFDEYVRNVLAWIGPADDSR